MYTHTHTLTHTHTHTHTGENIVVEVDRFDPGRLLKGNEKIVPTALIPGDIAIPCQVGMWYPLCVSGARAGKLASFPGPLPTIQCCMLKAECLGMWLITCI